MKKYTLEDYKINGYWLNTRSKHYKKHITPALETKEANGITRNNNSISNEYIKTNSDKYAMFAMYQPKRKVRTKKRHK